MGKLVNRARMLVAAAPGTGAITLGSAAAGHQTFAAAGLGDGDVVSYVAEGGYANGIPAVWEYGQGTYSASGPALTRTTVQGGTSGTTAVALPADSQVFIAPLAVDLGVPTGTVIYFASSTAPAGFLKANGALVSRTTYAALFAAIGTTFGAGDGSTTFALPDLRGEFVRGWDDARGVDSGRTFGSAQADAFRSHTHPAAVGGSAYGGYWQPGSNMYTTGTETGASGGSETRPRNVALLACIKY
jgi:microcystin-dependent protein